MSAPACFVAFDLLELDGESLGACPWTERRRALEEFGLRLTAGERRRSASVSTKAQPCGGSPSTSNSRASSQSD
jgi:ATP-dependent DNA ligase